MGRLMAKMGRPQIEIKQETFEGLCRVQCTLEEISSVLAVSEDTVERWCGRVYQSTFADVYRQKSAAGKASLRRTQFKMAENTPALAIWLGKQYLGQSDKQSLEHAGKLETTGTFILDFTGNVQPTIDK